MNLTVSKLLALIATILFAVAFVLVAFTDHNGSTVADLLYLGLAFFAGAHVV